MKKIGLLGGTFDPPHIGHLMMAEDAYDQLSLDEVWFIPTNQPPHKSNVHVDAIKRCEMVEIAIKNKPYFKVDRIELSSDSENYSIHTVKSLKARHKDVAFYFIIGADMVEYLPKWHRIDELIDIVRFVGLRRPGYQLSSNYPLLFIDSIAVDISSTNVRKRIKDNRPYDLLVPAGVKQYILEHQLYE